MPGNATVQVRNTEQSFLATLIRLHKGVGGGIAWQLLVDTFALSMVTLGITGIVMWARGRNRGRWCSASSPRHCWSC